MLLAMAVVEDRTMSLQKFFVLLLVLSTHAFAKTSYYQCQDKWGQPMFSQQPCGNDAVQGSVTPHANTGSEPSDSAIWTRVEAQNAVRDAERDVARRERRVQQLEQERDNKIAVLKDRSRYAKNNLAGAQFHGSLATEMQAVTEQYNAKIADEERRIERIRNQMDKVRDAASD